MHTLHLGTLDVDLEDVAVLDLVLLDVLDGLAGLGHGKLLNPGLDACRSLRSARFKTARRNLFTLVGTHLEHCLTLLLRTDVGTVKASSVRGETLSHHLGQRLVGQSALENYGNQLWILQVLKGSHSDGNEAAVNIEDAEEVANGEAFCDISGGNDNVEVLAGLLRPLFVRGDDKMLGSHLHCVLLLAVRV